MSLPVATTADAIPSTTQPVAPFAQTAATTAVPSSITSSSRIESSSTTSSPSTVSTSSPSSSAPSSSVVSTTSSSSGSASPSSTSSISASSTTASSSAASSSTPSSTTTISTIYYTTTLSNGSVSTSASVTLVPSGSSNGSSTNVGAIAGGVVGGVVGLALIALIAFLLMRRNKRKRYHVDDSMFDPSRAQNHGAIDLADQPNPTVEPFYTPGPASTAPNSPPQMSQYNRSAASEGYGGANVARGPSSASSGGVAGLGAGGHGIAPMSMPEPRVGGAGLGAAAAGAGAAGMNAKQREAYEHSQQYHVANQAPGGAQQPLSPGGSSGSGGVTVHRDGGMVVPEEENVNYGSEIPPT